MMSKPLDANAGKKDLDNLFMHLTNYAVNKEGDDFKMPKNIDDDSGHKRSLATVLDRLEFEGHDPNKLMSEIKDIVVKTILPI